ncbi:unnamed protein product [Phaeothamnion confervicola]
MSWLRLLCLVLLLLPVQAFAQDEVSLYDQQVSVVIPHGLHALTSKALTEDYPSKNRPQYAYKNGKGDFSVVFNHLSKPLLVKDLLPFHTQLKQQMEKQLPGIQWLNEKTQLVQGRSWELLEFKAHREGENLHNWIFLTSWKGRAFEVIVSAFDDIEGQVAVQVQATFASLKLVD